MSAKITLCDKLFALLSDGSWHHMREVQEAGGWRYGARLHELRKNGRMDHETVEHNGAVYYKKK